MPIIEINKLAVVLLYFLTFLDSTDVKNLSFVFTCLLENPVKLDHKIFWVDFSKQHEMLICNRMVLHQYFCLKTYLYVKCSSQVIY